MKPICVSLLSLSSTPPTPHSRHASLLDQLYATLFQLPQYSLTGPTINYTLFPLTSILRQSSPADLPDSFLEAAFRVLTVLVRSWRELEGGIDPMAWEQLWRFTTACIGPGVGKGKGKERSQDVQLEAVNLLTALLEPSTTQDHPSGLMRAKFNSDKSPLMPTLFQTITLLLATSAPDPPYLSLQLQSLRLLRHCIRFLKGQHRVLAAVLPGTVSAMSKLVSSGSERIKGDVAAEMAGIVEEVIVLTVNDDDLRQLGLLRSKVDDLSQLNDDMSGMETEPESPRPALSKDPFPPLTQSYLSFTSTQLASAIPAILSLSTHQSSSARQAVSSLAFELVSSCSESLALDRLGLTTLLQLSKDDFDTVRLDAQEKLRRLCTNRAINVTLVDILSSSLSSLPRLIMSQQDEKAGSAARLITALAETDAGGVIAGLLGPHGKVERWGWSLLSCLEFGKPSGSFVRGTQTISNGGLPGFPHLPLRYVESGSTTRELASMLTALGSAGGEIALHSVEHFILFAKAHRGQHVAKAVSAIWVADRLLDGIASAQENGIDGKVSKAVRKMAREVARAATVMDEDAEDTEINVPSDDLVPIERTTGTNGSIKLFEKDALPDSHAADTTRKLHLQAQRTLLDCLSLSLLSTSSRILTTSFRTLLLNSLYTLLSRLGSQDMVGEYAEIALSHVAYNTGYASVQNLVLDNVDYVINVVSQRLTYRRLDSQAPLVLISMIRLVGDEIVPMVHDVVDEIFDALDDYHGYEALATSLLSVLITLIDVMNAEVQSAGISPERLAKKAEMNRMPGPPDPAADFAKLQKWYDERSARNQEQIDTILERAPRVWKKDTGEPPKGGEEDGPDQDVTMEGEDPNPPTRSQEVAIAILSKSIYFLTHPSPFLRARILGLVARATPVLASANREAELLPSIDQAWGGILNRLDDGEPYVVTEAADLIASLCEHVGDFMSRRVLDQAWPRMKALLDKQRSLDAKSALVSRHRYNTKINNGQPGSRGTSTGTSTSYSVSHRLHVAILRTARFIAQEVPVGDSVLWEMMLIFRWFLDTNAHEELQQKAMELYRALGKRDGDAVWVVLESTTSGEGVWGYLSEGGLDISANASILLAGI